jgi:hypothetical protein
MQNMVKESRVRYTADIRTRANSNNYTNSVFRATMALEAGAESHVGATPIPDCGGPPHVPDRHSQRLCNRENVEEKSTLMWIMLYGVCGALQPAAMDARIIRGEEGNDSIF